MLLWFIYFALNRNYGEQSQRMGAIRLMDNALFCIFSCIFFSSAGLLVVGEMSIWFHWVCLFVRDGFHLYSFFGTCFLRSSFSTLHSVILILGFTAGFLFRFLVLVLFVFISVYLGGGVLPTEYEIISLSN